MKKNLLFLVCILFATMVYGQENPAVTQRLKEKYGYVAYESGFYLVHAKDYSQGIREGLCDGNGKEIVPCIYKSIYLGYFSKYALIMVDKGKDLNGFLRKDGSSVLPCIYESVFIPKQLNYIHVKKDGKEGTFNFDGDVVIPLKYDEVFIHMLEKHDYCDVKVNGKSGLYHIKKKRELLPCIFDYISYEESMRGFKVELNEKYGLFSAEGKELIPCKFDILSYNEKTGFIEVTKNEKEGLYNVDGKEIIPCIFDHISYEEDMRGFEVEQNEKYGMLNMEGKEILPCIYDFIYTSDGDFIKVELNEKQGLYSIKDKKFLFNCEYEDLSVPSEDLILFRKKKKEKYGYMDLNGKIVIEPQYDNASPFEEGIAQVTKNGVTSIIEHPLHGTNLNVASGSEVWVDVDIPHTSIRNEDAFAFIIANENYSNFSGADYSHNDGKVFAEYCRKTLGLPANNVRYYEDATYGNIANALKQLKDIADVYDGEAKIIFYFSGLGITDDKTKDRYILPTDASLSALASTGYNVEELMNALNLLKSQYTFMIIDAPFNGNDKNGQQMAMGRGVMLSNKKVTPHDNIIGLLGSEEGNCYSSKQLQHGVLTSVLLEKLKTAKGDCDLLELVDTSCKKVRSESLKLFKEVQTPKKIMPERLNELKIKM